MGLGWDYDSVVLVYGCQPWQVLMSTNPGTVLMVDVFRSGLARVSLHFLNMSLRQCQLHWTPKMDLSSSRTLDVCIPREFFVLDLYSFNSWKNMPVKGKQSVLDTKELGWSQQHSVVELFFLSLVKTRPFSFVTQLWSGKASLTNHFQRGVTSGRRG